MNWSNFFNGLYNLVTLKTFTNYFKELVDKNDDQSSHRAINVIWGLGSFSFYWFDHFFYKRTFTSNDFIFIGSMAGVTTLAAIASKSVDKEKANASNNV